MKKLLPILLFASLATSCGQDKDDYLVTIKTSFGEMKAVLYEETPLHRDNFIKLTEKKYFDSLLFHRVMDGFMIQGGDPDSKKAQPGQQLGQGGPGYTVPAEFNEKFYHEKGALAAARLGDQMNPKKESSGSQFYIVQGRPISQAEVESLKCNQAKLMEGLTQMYRSGQYQAMFDSLNQVGATGDRAAYEAKMISFAPRVEKITGLKIINTPNPEKIKAYTTVGGAAFLDGEYTVFGKVISGLDVIDKIAAVAKDPGDRPIDDVRMTVTVEKMKRSQIEKQFGYKFPK